MSEREKLDLIRQASAPPLLSHETGTDMSLSDFTLGDRPLSTPASGSTEGKEKEKKEMDKKFTLPIEDCPFAVCGCEFKGTEDETSKHLIHPSIVRKHAQAMAKQFKIMQEKLDFAMEMMRTSFLGVSGATGPKGPSGPSGSTSLRDMFVKAKGGSASERREVEVHTANSESDFMAFLLESQQQREQREQGARVTTPKKDQDEKKTTTTAKSAKRKVMWADRVVVQDVDKSWNLGLVLSVPGLVSSQGYVLVGFTEYDSCKREDITVHEDDVYPLDIPLDVFESGLFIGSEVDVFYIDRDHWKPKSGIPCWYKGMVSDEATDRTSTKYLMVQMAGLNGSTKELKVPLGAQYLLPRGTITSR